MPKITVEMEDTLQETVEACIEEAKYQLLEVLENNTDLFDKWRYNGADHELVDGMVPIYTKEIDDLYYLHGNELEEAYHNAGIGHGDEDNHKQAAIFCYLEEKMWSELHDWAEELMDDFIAKRDELEAQVQEIEDDIERVSDEYDEKSALADDLHYITTDENESDESVASAKQELVEVEGQMAELHAEIEGLKGHLYDLGEVEDHLDRWINERRTV